MPVQVISRRTSTVQSEENGMKKQLVWLFVVLTLVLLFGCSQSPPTDSGKDSAAIVLVQRPQFVDTRPAEVIAQHIKDASLAYLHYKKPPPPPPDTGSSEDPNPNPPHKYAYIVGISDYEGTANDLQYCDDDAYAMRSYFQSQGFTIRMDVDRNATADAIAAGLQWLVDQAQSGDEIAFAYSGHGDNPHAYGSCIISTDLYYITHSYVMERINAAVNAKKLVTLDACVIGDFLGDASSGTIVATASNNTYSYDAPDLQQGAWTYFFLEGAQTGLVFAEDVAGYAESGMRAWAKVYHLRVSPTHVDMYTGKFDI